uniref:Uncharacterized protein n=1 Tax=Globisporangium ultimum (strain ATCC 200006 / CBS 805.95 / DAOM BR144) TaxID=431595 RepID=K3WGF7_GLOUD
KVPDGIAPLLAKEVGEEASIGDLITESKLTDPSTRQIYVLVVVPKQVFAPTIAPPATKKRKLTDVRSLITSSSFAKCKGSGSWVKWLKKLHGQMVPIVWEVLALNLECKL